MCAVIPSHKWCNHWHSVATAPSEECSTSSAAAAEALVDELHRCRSIQPKGPVVWLEGVNLLVELHREVDYAGVAFALRRLAASQHWEAVCRTHTVCFIGSSDLRGGQIHHQHKDRVGFWALVWRDSAAFCRNVKFLDLQGVFLDETDVADFAQRAMPCLTSLEVLDLSSAHITKKGIQALVSSSRYLIKIKMLKLAGNLISNQGVAVLANQAVQNWPQLHHVNLQSNKCSKQVSHKS